MSKRLVEVNAPLKKASSEDVNKGWIRISKGLRGGISSRAYVEVEANDRRIWCQVLGTPGEDGCVKMGEWYRELLGWTDLPTENVRLKLREVGLRGKIEAWRSHPDDVVHVGIGLGFMSVGLGALGFSIAFVPLIPNENCWLAPLLPALTAGLVFCSILAITFGFSMVFMRKLPKE